MEHKTRYGHQQHHKYYVVIGEKIHVGTYSLLPGEKESALRHQLKVIFKV